MHLIKVAAYAAIAATAATACPGVVSGDCPPRLHKRSVIQLDDGQLTSGRGEAVKEIPDGQIIAGAMPRVQQAPDGQIVAPKIEGQEQVTTVVNVVTVTIPVEPFTRLITVTQSSNNTSKETTAAPLPPFTSDIKVTQITVAPFANTTTTLKTLTTQGAEVNPGNIICPFTGRCPNLTQNRRGYVFDDSVISQQMVAFHDDAPALCDAQHGCVAYQIGPMRQVNIEGFVNSNSGAPRMNSQESIGNSPGVVGGNNQGSAGNTFGAAGGNNQGSAGNTFGVAGGNSQGSVGNAFGIAGGNNQGSAGNAFGVAGGNNQGSTGNVFGAPEGSGQGSVAADAANEDRLMATVNLLNSSPESAFDHDATNYDPLLSDEFIIYDHVCFVTGIYPDCVTLGGVGFSAPTSSQNSTISATITSEVFASTLERSSIQTAATSEPEAIETSSSASTFAESISSISSSSSQQPPTSSLSSSPSLSPSPSSSSLNQAISSSTVTSQSTSSTISQPPLSSAGSTVQTASSGSDLPSQVSESLVSSSTPASSASSSVSLAASSTSSTPIIVPTPFIRCTVINGCYIQSAVIETLRDVSPEECKQICDQTANCESYVLDSSPNFFCGILNLPPDDAFDEAGTSTFSTFCRATFILDRTCNPNAIYPA